MEPWEALVESWSRDEDVAAFTKLSHCADALLKEDLTDFEIEWVWASLLGAPVRLSRTVDLRASDPAWSKPLGDALRLLARLAERWPDAADSYHDALVRMCSVRLDARARAAQLRLLSARASRSLDGLRPHALLADLEAATTCRAPLAQLLGTICEWHPEALADEAGRVWRVLLHLLDNNTETVRAAALRAASQVLERYGEDLPVREVALLYPHLVGGSREALELLAQHAALFREQLLQDTALRRRLWATAEGRVEPELATNAAVAATDAALRAAEPDCRQSMVCAEMTPLIKSPCARVRFAAVRLSRAHGVPAAPAVDALALQHQLQGDNVPDHVAEAVWWCVESGDAHAAALLTSAVEAHARLSHAQRTRLLDNLRAQASATAPDGSAALEFLLSESSRAGGEQHYSQLWAELCVGTPGAAPARWLAARVATLLRAHATDFPEVPARVQAAIRVCARALVSAEESARRVLAAALTEFRAPPPAALLLLLVLPRSDQVDALYQGADLARAADEEALCACALAAIHAPHATTPPQVLAAVQEACLRRDAEPSMLSAALRALTAVLDAGATKYHARAATQAVRAVRRLWVRGAEGGGRADRQLRRDLLLFLGKYGCGECDSISDTELVAAELRERLTLVLPADAGADCNLSMRHILHLALDRGHARALRLLAALLADHPDIRARPPEALLRALAHVVSARASLAVRGEGAIPHAPALSGLVPHLLERVWTARGGARGVLCGTLRPLLRGAELQLAAQRVLDVLAHGPLSARLGALTLTSALVSALTAEPAFGSTFLPRLPPLLARGAEQAALNALKVTFDALKLTPELFSEAALEDMVEKMICEALHTQVTSPNHALAYSATLDLVVQYLTNRTDGATIARTVIAVCDRDNTIFQCYYLLAKVKEQCKAEEFKFIHRERWLVESLKRKREGEFDCEAVLMFVAAFGNMLLENYYEETVDVVQDIVSGLAAVSVPRLQRALATCAACLPSPPPRKVTRALEAWANALPLHEVAEHLSRSQLEPQHACAVRALRGVLEAMRAPHAACMLPRATATVTQWPALIFRLQDSTNLLENLQYLGDALWIGLALSRAGALQRLLLTHTDLRAARVCMPYIYTFFLRKPFLLCEPELAACCTLLRDIAACCTQHHAPDLLELADEVWEQYSNRASATEKAEVVRGLVAAGATARSRCVLSAARRVADVTAPLSDRAVLLPALPPLSDHTIYASYCGALPARLADCTGERALALRALLDAAVVAQSPALLDTLAALASGPAGPAWVAPALEACMCALAARAPPACLHDMHARVKDLLLPATDNMLVPLLRASPTAECEEFFSHVLESELSALRAAPADSRAYRRALTAHARAATLIALLPDKVSRYSLESPTSALHARAPGVRAWHYVREACKLLVALQRKVTTPVNAPADLSDAVRVFQERGYSALCALVCVWRADVRLYAHVTGAAWLVLARAQPYNLPLRARETHRKLAGAGGDARDAAGTATPRTTRTARTPRTARVFLRTLTENPYSFDLFEDDDFEEKLETHGELIVADSEINRHPCAAALSALLVHLASYVPFHDEPTEPAWLRDLCAVLREAPLSVRYLLAQCAVNVRAPLLPVAGHLAPALLAVVADTASDKVNSLHLQILETVVSWHASAAFPLSSATLTACAHALARTCAREHASSALRSALLARLAAFLQQFPSAGLPETDVLRSFDSQDRSEVLAWLRVVARACSAGVHAPDVLAVLLARLHATGTSTPHMAEHCAAAGAAVRAAPPAERLAAEARLASAAARARAADPAAYVAMLHHARCTDLQHFNNVADIACKVRTLRAKCVLVLAGCVRAHVPPRALRDLRDQLPPDLRADVFDKCPDLVFEEFFPDAAASPPQAKRARVDCVRSRVLDTRVDERAFARALARLPLAEREQRLVDKLSEDLPTRLVECVYTCVYLPATQGDVPAGGGLPALARLLLRPLRAHQRFQRATIPALCASTDGAGDASALRTASLRLLASVSTPARSAVPVLDATTDDQPIPMDEAVDILLHFGETCWEAAASVVADVWRALAPRTGPLAATLASVLGDALIAACHPAPLRLALLLAPLLDDVSPLQVAARAAYERWARSEAAGEARALHDELRMRDTHPAFTTLGLESVLDMDPDDNAPLEDLRVFSLEALVGVAGALAEWRRVPYRERRRALRSLPPLWATTQVFRRQLAMYHLKEPCSQVVQQPEENSWWGCCVRVLREGDATRVLRIASRWPVRTHHLAAVCEAVETVGGRAVTSIPAIYDDSCLAEWAARLQLRAHSSPDAHAQHNAHARAWCRAALARDMPLHALHCVNVHVSGEQEVFASELCAWTMLAARALLALARGTDTAPPEPTLLRRACKMAARAVQYAAPHEAVQAAALLARVHHLAKSLTDNILATCLSTAKLVYEREDNSHGAHCERNARCHETHHTQCDDDVESEGESCDVGGESERDSMRELFETAALYYEDTWHMREGDKSLMLACEALQLCASETGVAVLLNRLLEGEEQSLSKDAADCLLRTLEPLMKSLPQHYSARLAMLAPAMPAEHAVALSRLPDTQHEKWRACLRLLCGAERVLLYHLDALQRALADRDSDAWDAAFVAMETEVFDSPLAGPEYRALRHHRATLASHKETGAEMSTSTTEACTLALRAVAGALTGLRGGRGARSVAALCPDLHSAEATSALQHILRLPAPVLEIDDEIMVFTDSVSAPGVLSVQLAGGARRRFLLKRERGSRTAAGAALVTALRTRTPDPHPYPQVVSLGTGCELVEFLEGHERLRDLLQEELDLDGLAAERGPQDSADLAALSEQAALASWSRVVRRVPPTSLRRAWAQRCAGTPHFLHSQARYCAWTAQCAALCWLAGLGDRHLLNLLVEPAQGKLLAVDWGALGERDHLPARLTHQITAMLPEGWLEAALERTVDELRRTRCAVIARVALALRDPCIDWRDHVSDVEALLSGAVLTRDVTARVLRSDALARLVRALPAPAAPRPPRQRYSLQHQVGELLVQSTSPRALSVARTTWEPWL